MHAALAPTSWPSRPRAERAPQQRPQLIDSLLGWALFRRGFGLVAPGSHPVHANVAPSGGATFVANPTRLQTSEAR